MNILKAIFQNKRGIEFVAQGTGILQNWTYDQEFENPVLFNCLEAAADDVEVVYADGSTEIIDAQFLATRNMLIKQIKSAGTTTLIATIRLEV